jgi:hypothetical protein
LPAEVDDGSTDWTIPLMTARLGATGTLFMVRSSSVGFGGVGLRPETLA